MGLSVKNNNPGNLKDPATGGFRTFKTSQEGYAALLNDLQAKQTGTTTTGLGPSSTLVDFASKYAPSTDSNKPGQYAANLANQMGVRPDSQLKDLDLAKWASAVAKNEDVASPFAGAKVISSPGGKANIPGTDVPAPQLGQPQSFLGDVGSTLTDAGTGVSKALTKSLSGEINPLSGLIQGAGAIAGGVGGLTDNVLSHLPVIGDAYKGLTGLIGQGVGALASTNTGKGLIANYQQYAQEHPEAAGNIEAGVNIASAIPILKGVGIAKNAAGGAVSKVLHGAEDAVLNTVAPKLTPKAAAQALTTRGTVQKGLLRETQIAPDPFMQKVANTVKTTVPKFNPTKPILTNIAEVQKVTTKMAADLKKAVLASGADKIYPKRELISRLRKLEKPDLIAADNTLNNVYDKLIKRVSNLADQKGGKVSNLLDLRQEFDQIVKRQYPNLYSSDTLTPLRAGVKAIRDEITEFTAQNLPDVALKESLLTQHQLLTAIENMAEKATKGATKEIGTNVLSRFGDKHPVVKGLVKTGTQAAIQGTGIGAMMNILK